MPSFPTNATTETEANNRGFRGNPWLDADSPPSLASSGDELEVEVQTKASASTPIRAACYTRSQTTAGSGHPLYSSSKSADSGLPDIFGRRASLDAHETRPSLRRRVINASRQSLEEDRQPSCNDVRKTRGSRKRDTEVIVHEIQTSDSLPGVALKYNVSLATLRNANKLWANDSIHLRQMLYIPVEAVSSISAKSTPPHSPQPRPDISMLSLHSEPNVTTRTHSPPLRNSRTGETNAFTRASGAHTMSAGTTSTVRRVPLSELSFFPPPSHPTPPSRIRTPPTKDTLRPPTLPVIPPTPTSGLAGYLNSAKDALVTRLSTDSLRGSSELGEDPDDLELHIVGPHGRRRHRNSEVERDRSAVRDYIARSNGNAIELDALEREIAPETPRKTKVIRTLQPQPSPTMVIPTRPAIEKSARKVVASIIPAGAS